MKVDLIWGPVGSFGEVLAAFQQQLQFCDAGGVWIPDHLIGNNMHPDLAAEMTGQSEGAAFDYWHDPFVSAVAMHHEFEKPYEYGIGVTDLIRRGPVDIARTAATVSQAIGSPLLLGVGAGEIENLVPADYQLPEKPVGHFEAGVRVLRHIMDTGQYHGERGQSVNLGYNELPAKIYIGGQRPRMLRITAQYGDGWFPAWKMTAEEYAEKVGFLREKSGEFGRPCPELSMLCTVVIGRSQAAVYEELQRRPLLKLWGLQASGEAWEKLGARHPFGDESKGMFDVMIRDMSAQSLRDLVDDIPPQVIGEAYFVGNAEELLEQFKPYQQAGMERAITCNSFVVPPETDQEYEWCLQEYSRLTESLRGLG